MSADAAISKGTRERVPEIIKVPVLEIVNKLGESRESFEGSTFPGTTSGGTEGFAGLLCFGASMLFPAQGVLMLPEHDQFASQISF